MPKRLIPVSVLSTLSVMLLVPVGHGQNVPIITGSVGMVSATNAGVTSFSDIVAPVFALPIGQHILIEGRFNLDEFFIQNNRTGPYEGSFLKSTQIAQIDYLMNSHMTLVVGQSLVPFNIYNERLSQMWQQNFITAPLVSAVGTRDTGGAVGAQLRGNALGNSHVQLEYTGWFSKRQDRFSLNGSRAAGYRFGLVFPNKRLEIGTSFARHLQDVRYNSYGVHFVWLPWRSPLQVRSEYAHDPGSQGYWMEASYRLSQLGGATSIVGRIEPLFRMQQAFRTSTFAGDGLPAVDTKLADFGFDYHFPHEIRFNSSYSRRFAKGKDGNLWTLGVNYRFLFPAWPGRAK